MQLGSRGSFPYPSTSSLLQLRYLRGGKDATRKSTGLEVKLDVNLTLLNVRCKAVGSVRLVVAQELPHDKARGTRIHTSFEI